MTPRDLPRSRAGFTLIEMLASILLTSIVISVAVGFYINLSRATETATLRLRESRHAATIIDRVARDLQSAMLLVKRDDADPLEHPWIFLAEASLLDDGADRIKFVSRRTRHSQAAGENPSDLSVVSYLLSQSEEDGSFELYRFAEPGLPEGQDLDFPEPDDPSARLVARDIESFSLRFRKSGADWADSWNSTTLVESGQLPDEVEINLALLSDVDGAEEEEDAFDDERPPNLHTRRVAIHMRPIDLEAQIEAVIAGAGEGEGEGGCVTVSQCLERPENKALFQEMSERCSADLEACSRIQSSLDVCYTPDRLPDAVGCDR